MGTLTAYTTQPFWGLHRVIQIKHLAQCLEQTESSMTLATIISKTTMHALSNTYKPIKWRNGIKRLFWCKSFPWASENRVWRVCVSVLVQGFWILFFNFRKTFIIWSLLCLIANQGWDYTDSCDSSKYSFSYHGFLGVNIFTLRPNAFLENVFYPP